jgi:uncharacterized protein (TIRG00374 family)
MRNNLILVAKLCLSAGVIFTLGRRFEVSQLVLSLRHANVFYSLVSIFLAILAVPVVSNRWRLLAGIFSFDISTTEALRATFAGLFVGQVLPGCIGVDVVRGWMVWNMGLSNQTIIASLVTDRVVSLFAVALMVVLSMPILTPLLPQKIAYLIQFIAVAFVVIASISYFSFRKLIYTKAGKTIRWLKRKVSIKGINISMRAIFFSLGLAVLGHVLMIFSAYFLSLAIGIDTSFWLWLLIMPVVILATAIPISINGWGVREFVMIYMWSLFGIVESEAFLISICLGLIAVISSFPGLWFWLRKTSKHS